MAQFIIWNGIDNNWDMIMRPLGAYAVAHWIKLHGYTVKVIDFGYHLSTNDLVEITRKHIDNDTIGIGVSSTLWDTKRSLPTSPDQYLEPAWVINAREKLNHLNLKWVLGGGQAHFEWPTYYPWIRIDGPGEDPLLKLLDESSNKTIARPQFNITTCDHHYLDGNGVNPNEFLSLELGRGCHFKCRFCRYPMIGKKIGTYLRNPQSIEKELLTNYEKFGTTRYLFVDDTVNETVEKVEMLANIAQRLPFKLQWIGFTRPDTIGAQPEMIPLLKESGLISTFFGIESFNYEASKLIGKGWIGKYGKEFLLRLKEDWGNDITLALGLITGLIGETEQDLWDTNNWCIENEIARWNYYPLVIHASKTGPLSEFDINHSLYGYTMDPTPTNPDNWTSDTWTFSSARTLAMQLNKASSEYLKPAGWALGGLGSIGYDINTAMHTKFIDLDKKLLSRLKSEFIDQYVKDQLK